MNATPPQILGPIPLADPRLDFVRRAGCLCTSPAEVHDDGHGGYIVSFRHDWPGCPMQDGQAAYDSGAGA